MTSKPIQTKGPSPQANEIAPGLYLVATPIGNLRDITLRALDVLKAADCVACEDTRVSAKLFQAYGISAQTMVYNDHNALRQIDVILKKLDQDERVALVSDAGTPLVSDPGYKLVRAAVREGHKVYSVPGPSAVLSALQVSGLPTDAFCFIGFLPPKKNARQKHLKEWVSAQGSLVAFETAGRLQDGLEDILAVLGDREIAIVREITKIHEEARRASVSSLIAYYKEAGDPKGEIVLVIAPPTPETMVDANVEDLLREALGRMSVRDAAEHVATMTGQKRRAVYDLALALSKEDAD